MNWAELGDWGGMLGLRVTALSGWGKAYQNEARPTTNMSIALKILIPPKPRDAWILGYFSDTSLVLYSGYVDLHLLVSSIWILSADT